MKPEIQNTLQKAQQFLEDAEWALEGKRYANVLNRSYYVMYACMQALLFEHNIFAKTHNGIQSKFREYYIKTDVFPLEYNNLLKVNDLFRQESDYNFDAEIEEEDAELAIENARRFLAKTKEHFE